MTTELTAKTGTIDAADSFRSGRLANQYAASLMFDDFRQRKAANTINRHTHDLQTFADALKTLGIETTGAALASSPQAWQGITFGLVQGFVGWMLAQGYAVGTINTKLSTVKTYAALASKAGVIPPDELTLIRSVSGYSHKEAQHVDEGREIARRPKSKKPEARILSKAEALALRLQPRTAQGLRDEVLIRLLLDLGLRVSEALSLSIPNVDLERQTLKFFRSKVGKVQTHAISNGLLIAMVRYLASGELPEGDAAHGRALIRASRKGGHLSIDGMTREAAHRRVRELGERIGIDHLSPHDLRHTWATMAVRAGTPILALKDAGGWSSIAMPAHYVEAGAIANAGVIHDDG